MYRQRTKYTGPRQHGRGPLRDARPTNAGGGGGAAASNSAADKDEIIASLKRKLQVGAARPGEVSEAARLVHNQTVVVCVIVCASTACESVGRIDPSNGTCMKASF